MNCDICKKEQQWLDFVGPMILCKGCIKKNKLMGLIHRTHIDTFKELVKKLEIKSYDQLLAISRKDVESVVNLKSKGIYLKTTNIVFLE
jgi:phosphoribosyl-dephospho-CoA transferase